MTVDNEHSIYIGGLPYSATESTLHRVFAPYGSIVAVKIINNRATRGKCFAFVTFRNPRSVFHAIDEMNGQAINGRVVRVNGVTTRGGAPNFGRERFEHVTDRGVEWDRDRDHFMDDGSPDRRYRGRYSDRSRERDQSWSCEEYREKEYEQVYDHVQVKDSWSDRELSRDRYLDDSEQEPRRSRSSDWERERIRDVGFHPDRDMHGADGDHKMVDKDIDYHSKKRNGSTHTDHHSREISSDSNGDFNDEVKERLEESIQRREELKKEISQMEERLEDRQKLISGLRKKAEKLEDALVSAKRHSSQHKMQLTMLHKCFVQVRENKERIKSCELELQSLVDLAMRESGMGDDVGVRDGILTNGTA